MKNFIKGVLTDSDGKPSAKRVSLFLFVFTFITIDFLNLLMGKNLDETLKNQLVLSVGLRDLHRIRGEHYRTV
jgi:hypothetical protein